jgi:two-component system, NarL family, response regulator NreC
VCPHAQIQRDFLVSGNKIRCVLAHDHVLLRQGLRRLLEDESDIEIVSEATNAAECLRKVFEFRPDVVIADACVFGGSQSEAQMLISREYPQAHAVFLSMQNESSSPFAGLHAETERCALRQTPWEDLVKMVRNVRSSHGNKSRQAPLECELTRPRENLHSRKRPLTAREREVLKLLAEGRTVRAAATVLGVSSKTVDAHKFNLMRKLGIHNKAELVMWAIQSRVVKVPVNF